jgi:hypothetical protein
VSICAEVESDADTQPLLLFARHRRLTDGDRATFYQGGASGYVDYPTADSDHTTVLDGAP